MRKLATIRQIDEINPIPGADAIEVASVGGWRVVVKKGEYQAGDLAIYCEVDSWIPHELAPFLSKGQEPREFNGVPGERLRTVRLRGQLSQGLLLPLDLLPADDNFNGDWTAGEDVTGLLGVQKYEPPVPAELAGLVKGPWPSQVQKTDQERIQNLTNEWPQLSGYVYEVTEKLEGSSMTAGIVNDEFVVCSRNLNLTETETNSLWQQARHYQIEERMREAGMLNYVVQGEIIGEGIQGNHYAIRGQDFYVFDILDINTGRYLAPAERREVCQRLGFKHVPVVHEALDIQGMTMEQVLKMADGSSVLKVDRLREGLVFKRVDGAEHWKAVSNQYLLKTGG